MGDQNNQKVFKPEMESVDEFLERFKVQHFQQLAACKPEDVGKKAMLLACALPVDVLTSIQRKLKPTLLTAAKMDDIEKHLKSLYSTKKSIVGAAVAFVSRKQLPQESIEEYAKVLNDLASHCEYKDCCLNRQLRDIFLAGLKSSKLIAAILPDCDDKSFEDVVERAKTLEQLNIDIEEINPQKSPMQHKLRSGRSSLQSSEREDVGTVSRRSNGPPASYTCGRCTATGKHYASNCFAKDLKCKECNMKGHIIRACRNKKSKHKHQIKNAKSDASESSDEEDPARFCVMKYVGVARNSRYSSRSSSIEDLDTFPEVDGINHYPPLPSTPSPRSFNRFSPLAHLQDSTFQSSNHPTEEQMKEEDSTFAEVTRRDGIRGGKKSENKNSHFLGLTNLLV